MSEDKNLDATNLNPAQLTEDELSQAAGGVFKNVERYIRCNKDYCGYVRTDGRLEYVPCPICGHAMHFERHDFLFLHWIGNYYCDKCDKETKGTNNAFQWWHGTEQELIDSANAAL